MLVAEEATARAAASVAKAEAEVAAWMAEFQRSITNLPAEQRDEGRKDLAEVRACLEQELAKYRKAVYKDLAELQKAPAPPPEYVVDLTKVDEVRLAWLAGRQFVVLRHPALASNDGEVPVRLPPSDRVAVQGGCLSGVGPVTVWQDGAFLFFADQPWWLVLAGPDAAPMLITVTDNYRLGGPIELGFSTTPTNPQALDGQDFGCYLDSEVSGATFVLESSTARGARSKTLRVVRWLNGVREVHGEISLEPGELDPFVPTHASAAVPSRD